MTDAIKVVCNNIPRDIIYGFELTAKEAKEFDYLKPDELENQQFFRYRGNVYDTGEFMRIEGHQPGNLKHFEGFQGYASDSYFSGILIKYTDDFERVIVARYYA